VVEMDDPPQPKRVRKEEPRMLFHVTFEVFDNMALPEARTMRNEWHAPQMRKIMESGKVREAGLLSSKRGGFFLVDIDAPEQLYELFGPEFYDTCTLDAQPVTPIEKAGEMFGQWAEEGR
jgi:hypothetical protein